MKLVLYLVLVLLSAPDLNAQTSFLENWTTQIKGIMGLISGKTSTKRGLKQAEKLNKLQPPIGGAIPFPCNTTGFRSQTRPESVYMLRPGDIDVIATMGDSLSAANGATASNLLHVLAENRGVSWAIGGQGTWRQFLTLPNILKEFNPNLFGFSLADSYAHHRESQFNVAEPGAMSRDMPYMAKILVKRIKADKRVDVNRDWKLVTFFIGGNDFCADVCYKPDPRKAPDDHRKNLILVLDYLRDNLPRTLVNLVTAPNMRILIDYKKKVPHCVTMHMLECPCIFGRTRLKARPAMLKIMRRWQQVEEELALDSRYQKKTDFAVVLQPFVSNLNFPERETPTGNGTDWSFLSEDCFHFSQKGYARASNALWNNMLEPVGEKSTDWTDTFTRFLCPSENQPYFYTYQNSGKFRDTKQIL